MQKWAHKGYPYEHFFAQKSALLCVFHAGLFSKNQSIELIFILKIKLRFI